MRLNSRTAIAGSKVVLVPYRKEHVPIYHQWMSSPELLRLTASEPLTLEQEYDMQEKWLVDEDKLTFIILARPELENKHEARYHHTDDHDQHHSASQQPGSAMPLPVLTLTPEEISQLPMIGDVNLFFKGKPSEPEFEVEAEVMIADPAYRRTGRASESLQLILTYALTHPHLLVPPQSLVVRIGMENEPSIRLFQGLGFHVVKTVEVFGEVELRLRLNEGNEGLARNEFEGGGEKDRTVRDGDALQHAVGGPHTTWIKGVELGYP
ncbi:hypothetical protein SISNIDRAFT_456399 [Sistotremastrum niveocremeum HHB9708]|uniref:N-acetyltransferase domain-containing protein n=1 Tax=Sistotremastrum niveocremeum HHB9708 TaxID=1314777 RepID=A0A164SUL0_9AGAM|nr:hypothetical protein SISNIDRAFT_456399 [Sistotremastrum niveocremeum HHB9708]